jgi:DNA-binding NarL/FixJ family response regulator
MMPDRSPGAAVPVRVLVVEDHPVLRGVVRLACEHTPGLELAGEVETGEQALAACARLRPDVIVLDLTLPGRIQGLDVARAVRSGERGPRILVMTGSTEEEALFGAMRAGADGFLEKTAGVRFIGDALVRIGSGERIFTPEQERMATAELGRLARRVRESSGARESLTERELEILELLARGQTVQQAATRLGLSPRTVETHIGKAYRKLGVKNRVQAVSRASSLGLLELT